MRRFDPQIRLSEYRQMIQLDQPCRLERPTALTTEEREQLTDELIRWLVCEDCTKIPQDIPAACRDQRNLLRALLNVRAPKPLDKDFLAKLDRLLQAELLHKGVVQAAKLEPVDVSFPGITWEHGNKCTLWQGDITLLEIDAVVNAANADMLGCFWPLHACIDNAIHSAAGPQLREDCYTIMELQKTREKTGDAKITRAYNLPSKFVLHTVGPIVPRGTMLHQHQREELAACYIACLQLAKQVDTIKSIAFSAISTGVFGFPKQEAAEIAVSTVNRWLCDHPRRFANVIFCVFSKEDYHAYARTLGERRL